MHLVKTNDAYKRMLLSRNTPGIKWGMEINKPK